jgi:solute:Na+ symporter, SSS family
MRVVLSCRLAGEKVLISPLSASFIATFLVTIIAMLALATAGTRQVRNASDFSLAGRKSGSWGVAGGIMGTLVVGASTVGTVQLAFLYGVSAWWFTLGSGIACLFLGLAMAPALRQGMVETIPQFISRYHGERARVCASMFSALEMFIHIIAQLLACGAILATLAGRNASCDARRNSGGPRHPPPQS